MDQGGMRPGGAADGDVSPGEHAHLTRARRPSGPPSRCLQNLPSVTRVPILISSPLACWDALAAAHLGAT